MARKKVFLPEIAAPADLSNGIIHVEATKSGKRRDVPMPESVRAGLGKFRIYDESEWVFVRKNDGTKPLRDVRNIAFTTG